MLQPRVVIFTAVDRKLLDASLLSDPVFEALAQIERQGVPLVLSTGGTRAQLEMLRREIGHAHPFITEHGGGLFFPDGYFSLRLEGAQRAGRYFCVPFGRPYADATAAVAEIAGEAGASVVRYAEMTPREIARNTGESHREAEMSGQLEFSERFFFVGDVEAPARRFVEIARKRGWEVLLGEPICELYSGNSGRAVRYLMDLYRRSMRTRIRSAGIGCDSEHISLLSAVDQPFALPRGRNEVDANLISHVSAARVNSSGAAGWSEAVAAILQSR
jgi:predicted mannosyl-3-phosphoglycerate phosphatase (HAD superfamily)